ncbi:cuticle protein-like [Adelges cooleyi]|uniref:cuticle protein-like n=1 Tax=Adelges cooleyi TaxID=133065 RepID=UPI002180488F|nr:cuticle protein-like [Adelges cooleyi]
MHASLVVVVGLVVACSASPSLYYGSPQFYGGYYQAPASVISPIKTQYHTQNELGQYSYGYNDGYSSKTETKHANGLTEGSYSYVDPNGVLQQYKYESDENGYRVSGTNLPSTGNVAAAVVSNEVQAPQPARDTPEVAAAKAAHRAAYEEAKKAAEASPEEPSAAAIEATNSVQAAYGYPAVYASPYALAAAPYAAYGYAPAAAPYAATAYAAAPYVQQYSGVYSPVHSQYHAQDEYGQYSYGYSGGSSSKAETKTLDGVTRGGYSYVDANGILQQYQYVSDPVNGFRISGTNLPSNSL